jgi:hypothetical protein
MGFGLFDAGREQTGAPDVVIFKQASGKDL